MSTEKRRYQLRARADRQRQTRERIVAATVSLHQEVGPARTTIADIARRAGVQRLTVYNAFPEPRALLQACSGAFLAANPPADILPGPPGGDALAQLEAALRAHYGWYRATAAMERHVHRDRDLVPALDAVLRETADAAFDAAAAAHAERLATGPARTPVAALVRLALDFRTWDLLTGRGLDDDAAAALMARAAACAAEA